ncbi:MAG: hypothetical protein V7676_02625 [Parasphingorhabdus sp.]|uniref:hypothetical protein n=1 Tax=Parasphingorhabdus sp. TaxID=2709688 RepID=UPI0030034534
MQFIKTLFWVILAVILVVFSVNNWSPTSVLIWENIRIDTKLPVLVIGAFLLGFVPLWLIHRASKWRFSRRIKTLEAAVNPAPTTTTGNTVSSTSPAPSRKSDEAPLDLRKEQVTEPAPAVSPIAPTTAKTDKATGI